MNLKQGQEVRDAADPDRIGIVVGTGSSLGARVLWCWDESLTWTSERPVTLPTRTPDDARFRPVEGDRKVRSNGASARFVSEEDGLVYLVDESSGEMQSCSISAWSAIVEGFEPIQPHGHGIAFGSPRDHYTCGHRFNGRNNCGLCGEPRDT
jgi:hypothetical protein